MDMPEADDPHHSPALVVAGGSARGLAWSAWAAGWRVYAADCFGDADLDDCTAGHRVVNPDGAEAYPDGLVAAVGSFPPAAWCYCGALENHPHVVARIAATRRLVGNPPAAVAGVRDPRRLALLVHAAGLHWPETHDVPHGLPVDGSFLVKPLASAGGRGVMPWRGAVAPSSEPRIWQRRIVGRSYGVSYVLAAGCARLYGVARHLVRPSRRYAFRGAVAVDPGELAPGTRRGLERFGDVLAATGLVGMVGADVVVDGRTAIHVVEVNPRPTSSMELVERGAGVSCAAAHLAAAGGLVSPTPRVTPAAGGTWAKLIVHARSRLVAAADRWSPLAARWRDADDGWPAITDIPRPGTVVPAGAPLVTIFARGAGPRAAVAALRGRLAAFRAV